MTKKLSKSSYDSAVKRIRALMQNWFERGVDLFIELRSIDQSGVWRHPGHATFSDFLRTEFPTALGMERYQNVLNAVDVYGVKRVKQIGIESCHAVTVKALIDDPIKRALLERGIDNFVKKNGCAPDRNKVRDLVSSIAPETRRVPRELTMTSQEEKLRKELTTAKKRITKLEQDVRALRKDNAMLKMKRKAKPLERVRLAKKKKAGAKRSSARAPN
ncbi:hypothetical protein LCGC14_1058610 [marine sediment metagenome]|uniref:Uncharacterized protein n=1 Tax=marine sediment metagenome TaxID=412755 RepID=A0A0F9N8M5_9ZZZZ